MPLVTGSHTQSENPLYSAMYDVNGALLTSSEIAAAGAGYSKEFFIKRSSQFSFELKCDPSDTPNASVQLQMQAFDGTWFDATGVAAKTASAARQFISFAPPYSRGAFRLKLTNNDAGAAIWLVRIHFNYEV